MKEIKISFRVTADELEELEADMKKNYPQIKGKRSEYIREKVLHGELPIGIDQDIRDLKYQVKKVGTNINQIAKKMNAGFVYNTDADYVVDEIQRIESQFQHLIKIVEGVKENRNH